MSGYARIELAGTFTFELPGMFLGAMGMPKPTIVDRQLPFYARFTSPEVDPPPEGLYRGGPPARDVLHPNDHPPKAVTDVK
eukprot:2937324-Prymnesium_polylepis.1